MKNVYEPIRKKIKEWLYYELNEPKVWYRGNEKLFDAFRSCNDRDCVLSGGNLYADTLFSLWSPLKNTIIRINSKEEITLVGNINSKYKFLPELEKGDNLEKLLPENMPITHKLSRLFELGLGVENVFILPDRKLNGKRAKLPYRDYVPVFLAEAFPGGEFAHAWKSVEEYISWIKKEKLQVFFDGEISKDSIKDLAETGDIYNGSPDMSVDVMEKMIDNYISILEERRKCFTKEELEEAEKGMMIMEGKMQEYDYYFKSMKQKIFLLTINTCESTCIHGAYTDKSILLRDYDMLLEKDSRFSRENPIWEIAIYLFEPNVFYGEYMNWLGEDMNQFYENLEQIDIEQIRKL